MTDLDFAVITLAIAYAGAEFALWLCRRRQRRIDALLAELEADVERRTQQH